MMSVGGGAVESMKTSGGEKKKHDFSVKKMKSGFLLSDEEVEGGLLKQLSPSISSNYFFFQKKIKDIFFFK